MSSFFERAPHRLVGGLIRVAQLHHPTGKQPQRRTFSSLGRFRTTRKQLGSSAGGEKLGCSLYEVPPWRTAFPRHYHLANEEAIYMLEGSGTLRIGREEVELSQGTTWRCPWGAQRGRTNSSIPRGCAAQVPVLLHAGGAGSRRVDVGLAPHGRTS